MAERPDLSHLSVDERLCLAVAVTQGWFWQHAERVGAWVFFGPTGQTGGIVTRNGTWTSYLPDYLNDPAAWGPLMVAEHIDIRHHEDGRVSARTADRYLDGKELVWMRPWSYAPDLRAVCLAVLAKYGVEVPS